MFSVARPDWVVPPQLLMGVLCCKRMHAHEQRHHKQHVWYLQGVWKPKKISNPDYFEDETPLNNLGDIGAVAVEIWTMDQGYFFDNVLVTNKADKAQEYRTNYWQPKHEIEVVCTCSCVLFLANG